MVAYCCISTCKNTDKDRKMHYFPRKVDDLDRYNIWIMRVGRKDLETKPREKVLKTHRVCDIHFSENQTFPFFHNQTNLRMDAVPDLHLPAPLVVDDDGFQLPAHSAQKVHSDVAKNIEPVPGCSHWLDEPRTPTSSPTALRRLNSYKHLTAGRKINTLTPNCRKMLREGQVRFKRTQRLPQKNLNLEAKLKHVSGLAGIMETLDHVSSFASTLIASQIRHKGLKPHGRRFTEGEKLLGLAWLKCSPKFYKMVSRQLVLPSRKTVLSLVKRVNIDVGLSEAVLAALANASKKMSSLDRTCLLMWDEMSIEPALRYNDAIEGFANVGQGVTSDFAQHAMVFMLRGARRKWKQPLCYFLTSSGMKYPDIVRNIKVIVSAVEAIGLDVVATVCDQAGPNVAAIKHLISEGRNAALRDRDEYRALGFLLGGKEIVPLFDPPHLIKGIRNNLLKYNVTFSFQGDVLEATWDDIIALYNSSIYLFFHLWCNVTNIRALHPPPEKVELEPRRVPDEAEGPT